MSNDPFHRTIRSYRQHMPFLEVATDVGKRIHLAVVSDLDASIDKRVASNKHAIADFDRSADSRSWEYCAIISNLSVVANRGIQMDDAVISNGGVGRYYG